MWDTAGPFVGDYVFRFLNASDDSSLPDPFPSKLKSVQKSHARSQLLLLVSLDNGIGGVELGSGGWRNALFQARVGFTIIGKAHCRHNFFSPDPKHATGTGGSEVFLRSS